MKIDPKKLYSAREASDFLEVTEQTVAQYLRQKELKGHKKGPKKKWYVTGKEIQKLRKKWRYD